MESKLIVIIALATLTQSSGAQQSRDYGLSDSKSAQLRAIIDNQDDSLGAHLYSIEPIFDLLEILSTTRKYNLKLKVDGIPSLVAGALLQAKNGTDYTFNSIPKILGKACYPAQSARNAVDGDLDNIYSQIGSAIGLAVSGNYTDIQTDFKVFFGETRKSLENYVGKLYDAIRTCVKTNNADTQAAIEAREIESFNGLLRANNAVFDAIKVFAAGIPTEGDVVDVVPGIKVYRKRAKFGVQTLVEHSYSPIRGLYISTQLNRPEAGASLTSDQYAQIVQKARYKEAAQILLDITKGYLTRIQLGLSGGCADDDSSAIDAAEAEAIKYYRVGLGAVEQSVSTPDAVATSVAVVDSDYFDAHAKTLANFSYTAVRLAKGQGLNYSETLEQIKTIEDELRAVYPEFVRTIFKVVQTGSNTKEDSINPDSRVLATALSYVDSLFAGIRVMAKACHGIEAVSEDDFKTIDTASNNVSSLTNNFGSDISSGHVSAIKTIYKVPTTNIQTTRLTAAPTVPSIDGAQVLIVHTGVGFSFN